MKKGVEGGIKINKSKIHVWIGGWMEIKAGLRIAYSNQKKREIIAQCLD